MSDALIEDADPPLALAVARRLRDLSCAARHAVNARYGLTCYGREGHERQWALWRDHDDQQLIDWQDLGPYGIIWVIWADAENAANKVIGLEYRDDDVDPSQTWIRLMRLPDHRHSERLCSAVHALSVERVHMPGDMPALLRWFPHDAEVAKGAGFGLLDLDFQERMPPVALKPPGTVEAHPTLVTYQHRIGETEGSWGVFDVQQRRPVIPPIYRELHCDSERWAANRRDGGCDVFSIDGVLLCRHDHSLHRCWGKDAWYAQKDGRWGHASSDGSMTGAFTHDSLDALQSSPAVLEGLQPPPRGSECAVLPASWIQALRDDVANGLGCYKYEGLADVSPDGSDGGYADLSRTVTVNGDPVLLLALRYSSERWLVLEHDWEDLVARSLLRVVPENGRFSLAACPPGGDDEAFVSCLIAPP